jgi:hypothetical protein
VKALVNDAGKVLVNSTGKVATDGCPSACCGPATGACCAGETCSILTEADCGGGIYQGDGTVCDPNPCETGACCHDDNSCEILSSADCATAGGTYQGGGTVCDPNPCAENAACCYVTSIRLQASISGSTLCAPDSCSVSADSIIDTTWTDFSGFESCLTDAVGGGVVTGAVADPGVICPGDCEFTDASVGWSNHHYSVALLPCSGEGGIDVAFSTTIMMCGSAVGDSACGLSSGFFTHIDAGGGDPAGVWGFSGTSDGISYSGTVTVVTDPCAACCESNEEEDTCNCEELHESECADAGGTWIETSHCANGTCTDEDDPCNVCPPPEEMRAASWSADVSVSGSHAFLSSTVDISLTGSASFSGTWDESDYSVNIAGDCEVDAINEEPDSSTIQVLCSCDSGYNPPDTQCNGSNHTTTGPDSLLFSLELMRHCGKWSINTFVTLFGTGDGNGCHGVALGSVWNAFTVQDDLETPIGSFSFDLDHLAISGLTGHVDLTISL